MTKRWHSRLDQRTWRALVAAAGEAVATGDICRAVWPRKRQFHPEEYRRVREAALELAEPVRRGSSKGRPWLWRLREPIG
jgi:hypothetical protein